MLLLPTSWKEVTLLQWNEVRSIKASDFDSVTEYYVELLDIFGVDAWDFPASLLGDAIKQLSFIHSVPSGVCPLSIGDYTIMPLSEVTWGDFLTLEHYASLGDEGTGLIASMFVRQTKVNEWGVTVWETGYDEQERSDYLLDFPITDVFPIVKRWVDYKKGITESYHALFLPDIPDPDPIDDEEPEDAKAEAMEQIAKKWGYERLTYSLCDNDLSRLDEILSKKLILVLNFLSMKMETSN